jgi:hypothetical protein
MSQYQGFKRAAVQQQIAQRLEMATFPAPMRGLVLDENETYMQPGGALVMDNWKPTLRGASLRGGHVRWCDLHALDAPAWANNHAYIIGNKVYDSGTFWNAAVAHTSAVAGTFAADRAAHPTFWTNADASFPRLSVISSFRYVSGEIHRMFAANPTKIFDVSTTTPVLVKAGQTSGNHAASQMANQAGDWLIVVNDAGDPPLRYDGTTWEVMNAAYVPPAGKPSKITVNLATYPGAAVANGSNLTYVCKYRNRFFFIEKNSMNAWYLGLNSVGGELNLIPISGAATKGGKLLCCFSWSIDAGDGIDDKIVFLTNLGEAIIFTGGNPADAANWRQEGRYELSEPLGMNAHLPTGGDVLIATVDGIVPISGAITKSRTELELAAVTRKIREMWRTEVLDKREHPWTMVKWDEAGGILTTLPGGAPGQRRCLVQNAATTAFARFTGWDAMCWLRLRADCFFGTQNGWIMQADRGGYDDGLPYVATIVGGWEMFSSPGQTIVWRQARCLFAARAGEPFQPQISATVDYVITLPTPPLAGPDPGVLDLWDQGLWDTAHWDAPAPASNVKRNTGWVSIGMTGFSHAPIVQVTVAQQATPRVDLISISALFERAGVNV